MKKLRYTIYFMTIILYDNGYIDVMGDLESGAVAFTI